jgi:hypothetical protein
MPGDYRKIRISKKVCGVTLGRHNFDDNMPVAKTEFSISFPPFGEPAFILHTIATKPLFLS